MGQNREEALSGNGSVSLARVLLVLGAVLGAGAVAVGVQFEPLRWPVLVLGGGALILFGAGIRILPDRTPEPMDPQSSTFGLTLPGAWFSIGVLLAVSVAGLWLHGVIVPRLIEIGRSAGAWVTAVIVGGLCLTAAGLLLLLAGAAVRVIRVQGEKDVLILTRLLGPVHLVAGKLLVQRLLDGSGSVRALVIVSGDRSWYLPGHGRPDGAESRLDAVAGWLKARGARVVSVEQVAPLSQWSVWSIALFWLLFSAASCLAASCLAYAGAFWIQWAVFGTLHPRFVSAGPIGLAAVVFLLLIAGPLRGWTWKLVSGAWREPGGDGVNYPVTFFEGVPSGLPWTTSARAGWLRRGEGNTLLLRTGAGTLRMGSGAGVSVERVSGWRWFLQPGNLTARMICAPVRVSWTGNDGLPRSVVMVSRAGWSFRQERQGDRRLYGTLRAWAEGRPVRLPVSSPPWPGAFLAYLALLSLLIIVPFGHNYLVSARVRTGRWLPPEWISPRGALVPHGPRMQALSGAWAPAVEVGDDSTRMREWRVDLETGRARLIAFGQPSGTPSFPGVQSHFYEASNFVLSMAPVLHGFRGESEPRLIDLTTGRATPLRRTRDRIYPEGLAALYGDERLLLAEQTGTRSQPAAGPPAPPGAGGAPPPDVPVTGWRLTIYEFSRRSWSNHLVEVTGSGSGSGGAPVFFPGGRHALWLGHVLELESGKLRPVAFAGARPWPLLPADQVVFTSGRRLRFVQSAEVNSTRTAVWEVDLESARAERIAVLPEGAWLASADGDRWLLAYRVREGREGSGERIRLELHDHRSGRSVPVEGAPERADFHALVAGRPWMFSGVEGRGWVRTDLPRL